MNFSRIVYLARRVVQQVLRDRRTVALIVVVPMILLSLGALLFRADPAVIPLGVVNADEGVTLPALGALNLGQRMVEALAEGAVFSVTPLSADAVEARLREGDVQGVLVLPADFTRRFRDERRATLDLRLEGSNPTRSQLIKARVTEAALRALAGLSGGTTAAPAELPVTVTAVYLFAGAQFDAMDYVAPAYIALLAMFFVFLLTCVSFLRERTQGTMERLLATPATRSEIVLGYMLGLGLFALTQVSVILFYTIWVLKIHYLGSLGLLFVVVVLLALVGVSLGMLASAFARNEFQVVQFIPLLIFPQVLLGGTLWPVEEMPALLQPLAYLTPLTYANWALRDVMLKGFGPAEVWPNLLALALFVAVLTALGALLMRREAV